MTILVIRHAAASQPLPVLPAQLAGHRVLCTSCTTLAGVRQCLCEPQALRADWVVLDVGTADDAQWDGESAALGTALECLPAPYIELQGARDPGLEIRLKLQHAPAAVVVDQRGQEAGYPLSLAIVGHRLAQGG